MHAYATLSEAVNDLQRRGYTGDRALGGHCLIFHTRGASLAPSAFEIDAYYRFEGMNNPDDQRIVYAISSTSQHHPATTRRTIQPPASHKPPLSSQHRVRWTPEASGHDQRGTAQGAHHHAPKNTSAVL